MTFRVIDGGPRPQRLKPRRRMASGLIAVLLTEDEVYALASMTGRILQGDAALLRNLHDRENVLIIDGLLQLQAAGHAVAVDRLRSSFHLVEPEGAQ
jgi:hypothetical protein